MNEINELRRELSRLTGIDMFNPKFRDVFKKYFPNDEDAEEKRLQEVGIESPKPEIIEPKEEEVKEPEQVEAKEEDIEKAEDEREIDKIEEEKAEDSDKKEEKEEEVKEESEEIGKEVDDLKEDYADELFDAKLELALVKSNVREDKLDTAKGYVKYALGEEADLGKVDSILKEFPEWIKHDKNEAKGFGMSVDEVGDNLTEEEKRLKKMGINPRE